MPIYEFLCRDENRIYSFLSRTIRTGDFTPRCPGGTDHSLEKLVSNFAVTGRAKEKPEAPAGAEDAADDPRMMAAMAEMEREMEGMDEENPDPRRLGKMMRRMAEISGEKMPAEFEEMTRRLEMGEDPEKLEEEFGDMMDEEGDFPGGAEEGEAAQEAKAQVGAALRKHRRRPRRDPKLYELREYLD